MTVPTLAEIRRYPVKSLRGESVPEAVVEPWGLAGDRRWMLIDEYGEAITAREVNELLLFRPQITSEGLVVQAPHRPDLPDLEVPLPPPARQVPVALWESRLTAAAADPATDRWFTSALGRTAHLVHLDDPTRRATSARFSNPEDRVSFADGYPLLLTTTESLAALNNASETSHASAPLRPEPLSMIRFRPSVVVEGFDAWAEDDWRRIRIGEVSFRAVKGCARCVMTTVHPDTAVRGKEPIASLARIRRWDGATWFGINLIPDSPAAADSPIDPAARPAIRVGDPVEILDAVAPGDGPIRP